MVYLRNKIRYISIVFLIMSTCLFFQIKTIQVSLAESIQFELRNKHVSYSKQAAETNKCKPSNTQSAHLQVINQDGVEIDSEMKYSWVWKYIDECLSGSKVSRIEQNLDQRMSNQIYTRNMAEFYNVEMYKIDTGNHELDLQIQKSAAGHKVEDLKCEQDLKSMVDKLHQLQQIIKAQKLKSANNNTISLNESHIRLASLLESFGHYDSGVLEGRNVLLGSYSQCLRSQLILDEAKPEDRTSTRYCFAQLKIDKHLDQQLKERKKKVHEADHVLNVGICIPESCHSVSFSPKTKHLIQTLVDSQFSMPSSLYIDERLEVESIQCEPDKNSQVRKLPTSAKILFAFLASWTALVLYATYRKSDAGSGSGKQKAAERAANSDLKEKNEIRSERHIDDLINLQSSWRAFTSVRSNDVDSRVNLDTLSFIKVWGCLSVVYGHTFLLSRFARNPSLLYHLSEFDNDPVTNSLISIANIVDSFFVISGILMAYLIMKKLSNTYKESRRAKEQSVLIFVKQWFFLFTKRYLRLVPLFFLVFWFKKSLFVYLGSGPNWDYGLNAKTYVGLCRHITCWSAPFSLLVGFNFKQQSCLGTGWSITNDIFYAFAFIPILILMTKKPVHAIISLSVLSLASTYSMYSYFTNSPQSILHLLNNLRIIGSILLMNFSDLWYQAPHNRAYSVLVGMIFGYLIYKYDEQQFKMNKRQWPIWLKGIATKLSLLAIFLTLFAFPIVVHNRHTLLKQYQIPEKSAGHLMTSSRLIWALSISVVFLRMTTDWKDNILMKFCSANIWQIMEKLNFSILLIHMEIHLFKLQSSPNIPEFSWIDINYDFMSLYTISCLMGALLHIVFEVPINNLVRVFILDRISSSDKVSNGDPNDKHID